MEERIFTCDICKAAKPDKEILVVNFRFHVPNVYGSRTGYRRDICIECLKKFGIYEELKNDEGLERREMK